MKPRESEKIELKTSFSEWKEAIVALCAFANKKGGKVIIGMDDDGDSAGIQIGKGTIEDFVNKIKNHTDPVLYPSVNIKFDKMDLEKDIREIELDDSLIKKINKEYYGFKLKTPVDFVRKIGLASKNKITNAGYLCFTKENTEIYNARVKAARFKGQSAVRFLDEKEFDGNIINAVSQIMDFVKRHINTELIITGKPRRDEIWDYPLEALREAVINALVHRDYSDPGNIQIRIFDSSLEIWSPGFLPKEINIKNILVENRSVPRNKKLVEVFHKIGLMESWGTGFQRIVEECEKNDNKIPDFSEKAGAFVISFKKREQKYPEKDLEKLGEKLGENQIKIINFIQANKNITISELAKKLGISSTAVENNIAKLKEKRLIERVGSDKGGHWGIIKKS